MPDYLDHIKQPMDFCTMRQRIDSQSYCNLDHFEKDFNLIVDNCMKYNSKDTYFYRAAVRLRDQGGALLRKARRDIEKIGFDAESGMHLSDAPKVQDSPPFSWEDGKNTGTFAPLNGTQTHSCLSPVDRLLVPANREHLPLDKQLQQLLEKLDLTCAMKSSPSRSKRLKLLKKTINDVRSEMSLSRVVPCAHHPPSSTPSAHPEPGKAKDKEKLKPNGHFTDDEGAFDERTED